MIEHKNYKDESRKNWGRTSTGNISDENIQLGAILRIADATELMAKNHADLQREKENYKRWYQNEQGYNKALRLSNAALKGQITKLKKQLNGVVRSKTIPWVKSDIGTVSK